MPASTPYSLQFLIDAVAAAPVIQDPVLLAGNFRKDNARHTVYVTGKRAVVFAFRLQKQSKAIKIWPWAQNDGLRKRYSIAGQYLERLAPGYFVKMEYLQEAIRLNETSFDVLLMDWVGRQNVKEYIHANIEHPENIHALAEKIRSLHKQLNEAGLSHGHLHAGNIYIDANNELKLIGYDALYIKDVLEEVPATQLYPDYSHPSGLQKGMQADYFAALLLYLGAKAIAHEAVLWGRYKVAFQEGILFNAADFTNIKSAPIYKQLRKIQSPEIQKLLDVLLLYCEEADPANLQAFYTYLDLPLPVSELTNDKAAERKEKGRLNTYVSLPAATSIATGISTDQSQSVVASTGNKDTHTIDILAVGQAQTNTHPETTESLYNEEAAVKKMSFPIKATPPASAPEKFVSIPTIGKKEAAGKRKNKRGSVDHAAAPQQKKALLGGIAILLFILAAGYFFGELGDQINSFSFQPENPSVKKSSKPIQGKDAVLLQKKLVTRAQQKTETAIVKQQAVANLTATSKLVDTLPGKQAVSTKVVNTKANPVTDTVHKRSAEMANTMLAKQKDHKPAPKESADDAAAHPAPFSIGAPPKE